MESADSILTIDFGEISVDVPLRMVAKAPAMYELLKELEWSGPVPSGGDGMCPECFAWKEPIHRTDCKLAAVLKAVEGEE
jgi:hypothetical protein